MPHASSPSSQLPLALWPSAQRSSTEQRQGRYLPGSDRMGELRPCVARRAIEVYSDPGDLVLDPLCGCGTTLVEAIRLDRDAIGIEPHEVRAKVARINVRAASKLRPSGRGCVALGTLDALPHLLVTHGARTARRRQCEKVVQLPYGSADLILTSTMMRIFFNRSQLEELCQQSARVVKPGGFVVIVTRAARRKADVAAETVSVAESVGLRFWQHVVALLTPIRDGQLAADGETVLAAADRICHEDVLVFRRPTQAAAAASHVAAQAPATAYASGARR